jgi:hypothetical protein
MYPGERRATAPVGAGDHDAQAASAAGLFIIRHRVENLAGAAERAMSILRSSSQHVEIEQTVLCLPARASVCQGGSIGRSRPPSMSLAKAHHVCGSLLFACGTRKLLGDQPNRPRADAVGVRLEADRRSVRSNILLFHTHSGHFESLRSADLYYRTAA